MKHLLVFLFLVGNITFSQQLVDTSALEADSFIGYDSYKNLFFTKGMVIHKKGPTGVFQYTDFQLGPITSVDIINPLNVVVYYEQTNTAVLLDNRLTQIERISFNTVPPFINTSAATNAGGNRLWVFNQDNQQLELFNYRTNKKSELSQPIAETLLRQVSNFNYCYLLTNKKVIGYNLFGGILFSISFEKGENIYQYNEDVILLSENQLFKISDKTKEITPYLSPEITIKDLQLTQDFLYIYDGKKLHTFAVNQPKKK